MLYANLLSFSHTQPQWCVHFSPRSQALWNWISALHLILTACEYQSEHDTTILLHHYEQPPWIFQGEESVDLHLLDFEQCAKVKKNVDSKSDVRSIHYTLNAYASSSCSWNGTPVRDVVPAHSYKSKTEFLSSPVILELQLSQYWLQHLQRYFTLPYTQSTPLDNSGNIWAAINEPGIHVW